MQQIPAMTKLINELTKLPTIGPKTAQRLAFYLFKLPKDEANKLAESIMEVKEKISYCSRCFNIAEGEICYICRDEKRSDNILCVVAECQDVIALERAGSFKGRYHVLHGVISPIDGIGPSELKIKELIKRVKEYSTKEVILATNYDIKGDATALYLAHEIKPLGIRLTRLAYGLPVGSDIEYADKTTLLKAMEGRREF
ncbi:MAG: recombination mediator RecR [Candidatus Eremiobacterota bacterium]